MPKRITIPGEAVTESAEAAPTDWPPPEQRPKQRRVFECAYSYFNGQGRECFQHVRNRLEPSLPGKTKDFTYRFHPRVKTPSRSKRDYVVLEWEWVYQFPTKWKDLVYLLPELLEGLWSDDPIVYLAEGEKDALALAALGYIASSHHRNGKFSAAQARWFEGASRIVICMDRDAAGATAAWDAYKAFRGVGFTNAQISIVCAEGDDPVEMNDVSDHLAAGFTVNQLVPVDPRWVRDHAIKPSAKRAARRYVR